MKVSQEGSVLLNGVTVHNPESLQTWKILLNSGEDCAQGNLTTIVFEYSASNCLRIFSSFEKVAHDSGVRYTFYLLIC